MHSNFAEKREVDTAILGSFLYLALSPILFAISLVKTPDFYLRSHLMLSIYKNFITCHKLFLTTAGGRCVEISHSEIEHILDAVLYSQVTSVIAISSLF